LSPGSTRFRLFRRPDQVQGGSHLARRDRKRLRTPLEMALSLILGLLLVGGGWLGWQVARTQSELSRERVEQVDLTRDNRALLARREKLLAREQIIARAATLGLYPPRPEQIRKLGTR